MLGPLWIRQTMSVNNILRYVGSSWIIKPMSGPHVTFWSLFTILHGISQGMQGFPAVVSAWLMYVFQSVFNFFVVSGSGQAALTMPVMAPLADLVGVERQVAVVAFQLGDAFTNFIVPTSGCLLGALAAAKLDWGKWAKFQIKMQGVLFVSASIVMIIAVLIHF